MTTAQKPGGRVRPPLSGSHAGAAGFWPCSAAEPTSPHAIAIVVISRLVTAPSFRRSRKLRRPLHHRQAEPAGDGRCGPVVAGDRESAGPQWSSSRWGRRAGCPRAGPGRAAGLKRAAPVATRQIMPRYVDCVSRAWRRVSAGGAGRAAAWAQAPVSYRVSFPRPSTAGCRSSDLRRRAGRTAAGADEPHVAGPLRAARVREERLRRPHRRRQGQAAHAGAAESAPVGRARPRRHGGHDATASSAIASTAPT